jgi:hypothetical protein
VNKKFQERFDEIALLKYISAILKNLSLNTLSLTDK